jgi:hypothetical protein
MMGCSKSQNQSIPTSESVDKTDNEFVVTKKSSRFCKTDIPLLERYLLTGDRYLIANPAEVAYLIQRKGTRGPIDPKYSDDPSVPTYWVSNGDLVDRWMMCVYSNDQGQAILAPRDSGGFVPFPTELIGRRRWLPLGVAEWPEEEPEEK